MKAHDVSTDDDMVVDVEGSVWVWMKADKTWRYLISSANFGQYGWDSYDYLPETYEPYVALDRAARLVIRKGLTSV
jgi:hypothetical protein